MVEAILRSDKDQDAEHNAQPEIYSQKMDKFFGSPTIQGV